MLGPEESVNFEFHLPDWLELSSRKKVPPVLPEVEKLGEKKIFCFYGEEETNSLCKKLAVGLADVISLKGGLHFEGTTKQLPKPS